MSAEIVFRLRQSSDEKKLFGVRYRKKELEEAEYTVTAVTITATDEDEVDVSATILDGNYDGFDDNKAFFMTEYPPAGTYLIKVTSTMSDGSELSAWGLLIVVDPTI